MEKECLDFLVYCIFGDMSEPADAIINRAYVDMASHTMRDLKDVDEKWECRYNASNLIRESLAQLVEEDFDSWHQKICNALIKEYPVDKLSYGQAQKWINMVIKYTYVLKKLNVVPKSLFTYVTDAHLLSFHPPIDSYILKDVLSDSETKWSKMDYGEYETIRKDLKSRKFDFVRELHEWTEISEAQKEHDTNSYERYIKTKK